jgi:hypothetical protein
MILSRARFFFLILGILVFPVLLYNIIWLAVAEKVTGVVRFDGKAYTGQFVNNYSVVSFSNGKDTIWFNTTDGVLLKKGRRVPVYYMRKDPNNAKVGIFVEIWGPGIGYGSVPVLVLLLAFLHPSLVPRRVGFKLIGKKPFVEIVAGP